MSKRHSILLPGEGPSYDWEQDHVVVKTPLELTDGRVTVVEDTLKPGFHLAPHYHRSMVEIFFILDGEMTFTFDHETITASPGMTVNVPTGVWHEAEAPNGARLLTVFTPGGFDRYLANLVALGDKIGDPDVVKELGERHDIWTT